MQKRTHAHASEQAHCFFFPMVVADYRGSEWLLILVRSSSVSLRRPVCRGVPGRPGVSRRCDAVSRRCSCTPGKLPEGFRQGSAEVPQLREGSVRVPCGLGVPQGLRSCEGSEGRSSVVFTGRIPCMLPQGGLKS